MKRRSRFSCPPDAKRMNRDDSGGRPVKLRLQERDMEQALPNPYRPRGQIRWTPWRTVRVTEDQAEADAHLRKNTGLTQRRVLRQGEKRSARK